MPSHQDRFARALAGLFVVISTSLLTTATHAAEITIVSYNIQSYDDNGSSSYDALVRIVQALQPDILLIQEATDSSGRSAFMAAFADAFPHSYLGGPTYDNPRNQILSSFPMTASGSIYTDDPWGGTFERPTVYASLDIIAALPGPELRVYSAHLKAGYTSRDSTLRLNQAIDDAADIVSARTSNPDLHVFYGGDFNSEIGDPPLNKLTEPVTSMIRLPMADPNNNSPTTRWPSGRRIDFVLFSGSLTSGIQEYYIFNTTTFASGSVPAPALADDSHTASDHLALVTVIDFPDTLLPDYEPDGDVDDDDFSHFASCRSGANVSVESGCENTDLDLDGDNDQADFGIFQRCFSGTNEPLDPTCIE